MQKFNTLLTSTEVVYYTGISKDFPKCSLRTIHDVEFEEFRTCFGIDFYNHLIDKKADYSDAEEYDNEEAYAIDDVVSYEGVYYQAIEATTGNIPTNDEYWKLAPKFTEPCLDKMWCMYMASYLSWRVIFDRLPFINTQIKGTGLVKIFGNTFKAGSKNDFETIAKAILRSAERSFKNLDYYMKKNNDDECFNLYFPLNNNCCSECMEMKCTCDTCYDEQETGYEYAIG